MKIKIINVLLALVVSLSVHAEIKDIPNGIVDASGYEAYQKYLKESSNKAFVVSANGAWGWSSKQFDTKFSILNAIEKCESKNKGKCDVIDVNGHLTTDTYETVGFLEKPKVSEDDIQYFPASIQEIHKANNYKTIYLASRGNKAYATSKSGSIGWVAQRTSVDDAKKIAIKLCEKFNADKSNPCEVVDVNGEIKSAKINFADVLLNPRMVYPDMTAQLNFYVDMGVYKSYIKMMGHKALAVAATGYRHMLSMMTTSDYAKQEVLKICSENAGEKCNLVLLDEFIVKSKLLEDDGKPKLWLGKYVVDLTAAPHLESVKHTLPFFTFTEDEVTVTVKGKVVVRAGYFQRERLLRIFYKGKTKTGTFSEDFGILLLNDKNRSRYIKVDY